MQLTLIRGLPGSGKSTLAQQLVKANPLTTVRYEADMYFGNPYKWEKEKLAEAHEWCLAATKEALEDFFDVVVANTFVKKRQLQPYLDLANSLNVPVQIIVCQEKFQSEHNVPQSVIDNMRKIFEY